MIPNLLTGLRLALVPFLCYAAVIGSRPLFATLFVAGIATDVLDGFFARRLRQESAFGSTFDSVADIFFYATALWVVVFIRPPTALEWFLGAVAAVLPVLGMARCWLQGKVSPHTWAARVAGGAALAFVLVSTLVDFSEPLFLVMVALCAYAGIEKFCACGRKM